MTPHWQNRMGVAESLFENGLCWVKFVCAGCEVGLLFSGSVVFSLSLFSFLFMNCFRQCCSKRNVLRSCRVSLFLTPFPFCFSSCFAREARAMKCLLLSQQINYCNTSKHQSNNEWSFEWLQQSAAPPNHARDRTWGVSGPAAGPGASRVRRKKSSC